MEFLGLQAAGPVTRASEVAEEKRSSSLLSAGPGLSVPRRLLNSPLAAGLGFNPFSKAVPIWNASLSQGAREPGLGLGRLCAARCSRSKQLGAPKNTKHSRGQIAPG